MRTHSLLAVLLFAGACATDSLSETSLEGRGGDHDSDSDSDSDSDDHVGSFHATLGEDAGTSSNFFIPQGANGRSCATCHVPEDGWSFNSRTAQRIFEETGGLDPLFSRLDADVPTLTDAAIDAMTVEQRAAVFTQLLQGNFTRSINAPATRDYDITAFSDPYGVSTSTRMWFFRRSMPTANFRSHTVSWDSANTVGTVLRDGLIRQARGNVTGAQEGPAASDAVIFDIVDFEMAMNNAATHADGAGPLHKHGGNGGPENLAATGNVAGRFDLYDAWKNDKNKHRRAIYRGQELFNNGDANGRKCGGCHNGANNGQNTNGTLFDVGAGRPEFARADMAVFTFKHRTTGAVKVLTDPGRGGRNGVFADLGKFKTPTLRGLAARESYFHNGVATSLLDVVKLYEATLGFNFTDEQEADLVAFMEAL